MDGIWKGFIPLHHSSPKLSVYTQVVKLPRQALKKKMMSGRWDFPIKMTDAICASSSRSISFFLCDDVVELVHMVAFVTKNVQLSAKSNVHSADYTVLPYMDTHPRRLSFPNSSWLTSPNVNIFWKNNQQSRSDCGGTSYYKERRTWDAWSSSICAGH